MNKSKTTKLMNKLHMGRISETKNGGRRFLELLSFKSMFGENEFHTKMLEEHVRSMNNIFINENNNIERYQISTCVSSKLGLIKKGSEYIFGHPKYLMAFNCNSEQEKLHICRCLIQDHIDYYITVSSNFESPRYWIVCNYIDNLINVTNKMKLLSNESWVHSWAEKCLRERTISFRAFPKHAMRPCFGDHVMNFVYAPIKSKTESRRALASLPKFVLWVASFKRYWLCDDTASFIARLQHMGSPLMRIIRSPILERQREAYFSAHPIEMPSVIQSSTSPQEEVRETIGGLDNHIMNGSDDISECWVNTKIHVSKKIPKKTPKSKNKTVDKIDDIEYHPLQDMEL